jgi:hypothetical protein
MYVRTSVTVYAKDDEGRCEVRKAAKINEGYREKCNTDEANRGRGRVRNDKRMGSMSVVKAKSYMRYITTN